MKTQTERNQMTKQFNITKTKGFGNNFGITTRPWQKTIYEFEVFSANETNMEPNTIRLLLTRRNDKDQLQLSDLWLDQDLILELAEKVKELRKDEKRESQEKVSDCNDAITSLAKSEISGEEYNERTGNN